MNRYPKIVANNKDDTLPFDGAICPSCGNTDIKESGHHMTLVGCLNKPKHKLADGNHHWISCECSKCNLKWTKEVKYDIIWYTNPETRKVIKGIPNCFEGYILTCSYCGGDVHRRYSGLDGKTKVDGLCTKVEEIDGKEYWVKKYREFYYCKDCGVEEELIHEKILREPQRKVKMKCKVEIGEPVIYTDPSISIEDVIIDEVNKSRND